MRRTRIAAILGAVLTVLVTESLISTATSTAAPPTNDPGLAAEYAAAWSAQRVNASGFVPLPDTTPNVTATMETALALGTSRVERPTFDRIVTWAEANVDAIVIRDGSDEAGRLGELLMVVRLAGADPTSFGGSDLISRLGGTLGDFGPGLYGAQDPTYDGAFRQSLALLGLAAHGAVAPPAAIAWLSAQQCTGSPAAAAGGWEPYRADLAVPCNAPDPTMFVGPDTNSTAMAVQALAAFGAGTGIGPGLDFLAAAQLESGGFGFIPGPDEDPNSTSLAILAILAGGENPETGRWVRGSTNPFTSLLSWQLGCTASVADRGAFASPFSSGSADAFATRQAVWGAAGQPFPFSSGSFHAAAIPCQVTTTSSSSPTSTGSTTTIQRASSTLGTTVVPAAAAIQAATTVAAVPRFAG